MVFARILRNLIRDQELGPRIVPIIPDEARTFGMDPLFKEVGIYAALGQRYEPVDSDLVLSYREATDGQVLEEGITEAGSMASFQAAGTSYASHGLPTIPFYIFYSMFGFQRTGDQIWAFGDARGRGFLMGATAGRTTLTGEGLQHDDGHTHILASTVPNLRAYDPAFAYELAAVVRDGIERMYGRSREDVFYYVTIYNENYAQPPARGPDRRGDPARASTGSREAPDLGREGAPRPGSSGRARSSSRSVAARDLLAEKFGVAAEVYSAPSFPLLRRDALEAERWNRLHPDAKTPRVPYVSTILPPDGGPIVAATDWMKALPDMVSRWLPPHYVALGTDGFGRSDTRETLRSLFEIDPPHIAAATLAALARCGALPARAGREGDQGARASTRRSSTRPCSRSSPGISGAPTNGRRRCRRHASDTRAASADGCALRSRSLPSSSTGATGASATPRRARWVTTSGILAMVSPATSTTRTGTATC